MCVDVPKPSDIVCDVKLRTTDWVVEGWCSVAKIYSFYKMYKCSWHRTNGAVSMCTRHLYSLIRKLSHVTSTTVITRAALLPVHHQCNVSLRMVSLTISIHIYCLICLLHIFLKFRRRFKIFYILSLSIFYFALCVLV